MRVQESSTPPVVSCNLTTHVFGEDGRIMDTELCVVTFPAIVKEPRVVESVIFDTVTVAMSPEAEQLP
jgi:hypothetical protein